MDSAAMEVIMEYNFRYGRRVMAVARDDIANWSAAKGLATSSMVSRES